MRIEDAYELFLLRDMRPKSVSQYEVVLKPLVAWLGKERDLELVTEADLLKYQSHLRKKLKPVTVANYTSVIKALFNWCVDGDYLLKSPARRLERKRPPPGPEDNRAMPPEALRKIVDYARLTHPRNYGALMMMVASGVRVGGLLSMTWERTDLERQFAWVEDKGGGYYKAYFGDKTAEALTMWYKKHPLKENAIWTGKAPKHEPLKSGAIYALFKTLCERAGAGDDYHPHCIRHSRGHGLGKAGVPISVISRIMNHSDEKITAIYQPHDDEYVALIARRHELIALADEPETAFRPSNVSTWKAG